MFGWTHVSNLINTHTHAASPSPSRRAWLRFKRNRLGYWSLLAFACLVGLSLMAELISNDRPLLVRYQDSYYVPLIKDYPETIFGGDFETPTDYLDPFIRDRLAQPGNWAVFAPNPYGYKTLNYFAKQPNPSGPSRDNWLGTDDRGRDLLAQLIYGFRVSVLFALALTFAGVLLGVLTPDQALIISPSKIEKFYATNVTQFQVAEQVELRMIVIKAADSPSGWARPNGGRRKAWRAAGR